MTFSRWFKKYWDEVFLIVGLSIGFYFILKGGGIDLIKIIIGG